VEALHCVLLYHCLKHAIMIGPTRLICTNNQCCSMQQHPGEHDPCSQGTWREVRRAMHLRLIFGLMLCCADQIYTVFLKKWRQNSNHYNYDISYQN